MAKRPIIMKDIPNDDNELKARLDRLVNEIKGTKIIDDTDYTPQRQTGPQFQDVSKYGYQWDDNALRGYTDDSEWIQGIKSGVHPQSAIDYFAQMGWIKPTMQNPVDAPVAAQPDAGYVDVGPQMSGPQTQAVPEGIPMGPGANRGSMYTPDTMHNQIMNELRSRYPKATDEQLQGSWLYGQAYNRMMATPGFTPQAQIQADYDPRVSATTYGVM